MLTCLPQSLCSWNFLVRGAEAGEAVLSFNFFTEQGSIALAGVEFPIRKHGWLSGHWTLESEEGVYADAKKATMIRSFAVVAGDLTFTLRAVTMSRSFELVCESSVVGTIRPAHMFTRRAFVDCHATVPELVQLFAFWLVALTWRRAANNN